MDWKMIKKMLSVTATVLMWVLAPLAVIGLLALLLLLTQLSLKAVLIIGFIVLIWVLIFVR